MATCILRPVVRLSGEQQSDTNQKQHQVVHDGQRIASNFTDEEVHALCDLLHERHDHLSWEEIEAQVRQRLEVHNKPSNVYADHLLCYLVYKLPCVHL